MRRHQRKRTINLGGFSAVKLGVPSSLSDIYYSMMEIGWPSFVALLSAVFVVTNLAFGLIYAAIPGAIANMRPGSIADGFFFSVETVATVGYGNMAPATLAGHSIAVVEILIGQFFAATMTGLIFSRFARPRDSMVFSNVAVIGRYEGQPALMVRLASVRARPLANAIAQMSWLEASDTPDGRVFRRLIELPLVRGHNPMLALAWTLIHPIEEDSPMLAKLLGEGRFQLNVTVSGLDTLLASQSVGGHSYARDDVLVDHEFGDAIADTGGLLHLDLGKLHDVFPIAR